jgi:serine protease Do
MIRSPRAFLPLAVAASLIPAGLSSAAEREGARGSCTGRYADTLAAMSAAARTRESRPSADYAYCIRSSAVYEHLSYGRGGKLRRQYHTKVRHGTGFAYRQRGPDWLLATNQHVVSFPEVTGEGVDVEGIPPGSRRVRVEVKVVANEAEPDFPDQARLAEVVEDESLDVAVLASRSPLKLMPYRIGRSADLRVGNAVLARGFPLGAFPAANAGRVISVGQRDLERGWDHEDFAVDALLNLGSSGSPVLAVSCQTGEPELVGIYHAGYRGAQGLNVVVAVDGIRSVLEELVAPPRAAPVRVSGADPREARAALAVGPLVMPFGGRAVRVEREGEAVRFALLDPAFPLSTRVEVSIVDRGTPATGRAAELRQALWDQLGLVLRYRAAEAGREAGSMRERIAVRVREREDDQADLVAAVRAGADGLAPSAATERDPARHIDRTRSGQTGPVLILGSR